jgi:flagellar biosynthesis/type III secretory pathway protein FliH
MRHDQTVRFSRPLRAVRIADPNAPSHRQTQAESAEAPQLAEQTVKHLEQQSREAERDALQAAVAGLVEAAGSLTSRQRELLGEMQQAAVELAVAIASRVTYDNLQSDRFAIEDLARSVVGRLQQPGPVEVRLHPDDIALLRRRLGEGELVTQREIHLIADESLGRGDCVVAAGDVSVASQLEEQLAGIRQHLLRNLSHAQVERRKPLRADRELRRFPNRRETA